MKRYTLILFVSFYFLSCKKQEDTFDTKEFIEKAPTAASPSISASNFSITRTDSVSIADGIALTAVKVTLDSAFRSIYKSALFSINPVGSFAGGASTSTVLFNVNGQAVTYVSSVITGLSTVSAQLLVGGPIKNTTVQYIPALPDQVLVNPSAATLPSAFNSAIQVTAHLTRPIGAVSPGQQIYYYDSTSSGTSPGIFLNPTFSNNAGESTATFALQDTSYHGFIYLKAYALKGSNRVLGTNRIFVP